MHLYSLCQTWLNLKTHTVSETENRTSCLTTAVRQSQSVAVSQTLGGGGVGNPRTARGTWDPSAKPGSNSDRSPEDLGLPHFAGPILYGVVPGAPRGPYIPGLRKHSGAPHRVDGLHWKPSRLPVNVPLNPGGKHRSAGGQRAQHRRVLLHAWSVG